MTVAGPTVRAFPFPAGCRVRTPTSRRQGDSHAARSGRGRVSVAAIRMVDDWEARACRLIQASVFDTVEVAREEKAAAAAAVEVTVQAIEEAGPVGHLRGSIDGGDGVRCIVEGEVDGENAAARVRQAADPQVGPRHAMRKEHSHAPPGLACRRMVAPVRGPEPS